MTVEFRVRTKQNMGAALIRIQGCSFDDCKKILMQLISEQNRQCKTEYVIDHNYIRKIRV